jgi:hypothetical protein
MKKQPDIAGMSYKEYAAWFEKLPVLKQYELQRKAGFAVTDLEHEKKRKQKARDLGLPATAKVSQILYLLQGGSGIGCGCSSSIGSGQPEHPASRELEAKCAAVNFPVSQIHTDPARFQNRTDAFSELSAQSVAEHYDTNKFDPIVIWLDGSTGRYYVLSGQESGNHCSPYFYRHRG